MSENARLLSPPSRVTRKKSLRRIRPLNRQAQWGTVVTEYWQQTGQDAVHRDRRETFLRIGKVFLLLAIEIGVAVLGGVTFEALESDTEREEAQRMWKEFHAMNLTTEQRVHWDALGFQLPKLDVPEWDVWTGAFFIFSTITTIGYGNITPKTGPGKAFTLLYGAFGMVVMGYILSYVADMCVNGLSHFLTHARKRWRPPKIQSGGHVSVVEQQRINQLFDEADIDGDHIIQRCELVALMRKLYYGIEPDPRDVDDVLRTADLDRSAGLSRPEFCIAMTHWYTIMDNRELPARYKLYAAVILVAGLLAGGGALFWTTEDGWDYGSSVYFCFVSLSTIGFGDYVPGRLGQLLVCIYVFTGLGSLAAMVSIITELVLGTVEEVADEPEAMRPNPAINGAGANSPKATVMVPGIRENNVKGTVIQERNGKFIDHARGD